MERKGERLWNKIGVEKGDFIFILPFILYLCDMKTTNKIAKIDNQFVLKSHYSLSANEQKLILFLVSKINPKERTDFTEQEVKIRDIEKALAGEGKQWNSIYERVDLMCQSIMSKPIKIPKGFVIKGEPIRMHEYYNWFSSIKPRVDGDGELAIKFKFDDNLKDFLLQLSEYVQISIKDVLPLRGKHSIRMYQIFKSERQKIRKHKGIAILNYGIDELKAMLGISGKYGGIKDFRRWVLEPMKKEINEHSTEIRIDYSYVKTRRKVTGIEFKVFDAPKDTKSKSINKNLTSKEIQNFVPSETDLDKLSYAQLLAFQLLKDFHVYDGIAYAQIIPTIKAGDVEGFEDLFVKNAISHFLVNTKVSKNDHKAMAGAFVNWWLDVKVFDHTGNKNSVYWKVIEKVHNEKKNMSEEKRVNRYLSIGISSKEFIKKFKEGKTDKKLKRDELKKLAEQMKI